jgi:hypothetical protein
MTVRPVWNVGAWRFDDLGSRVLGQQIIRSVQR